MFSRILISALLLPLGWQGGGGQTPLEQARMDQQNAALKAMLQPALKLPMAPAPIAVKAPAAPGWALGMVSWVAASQDGLVYLLQRGEKADPVIAVGRDGNILRSWGKGMFTMPHAIRVDPQGNVWTTDASSSMVYKFKADGTLLMKIEVGGQPSACANNFCSTTDVAFAGDGHIFIADGYRNARILEYTADGKKVNEWGKAGTGPGEFRLPHSIQIDERGIIYVADRENGRIQRFDRSGKFLGEWTQYGKTFGLVLVGDALWLSTIPRGPNSAPGWLIRINRDSGALGGFVDSEGNHGAAVTPNGDVLLGPGPNQIPQRFRLVAGIDRLLAQPSRPEAIRPFTIRIPDAALADLKARLANSRISEPLQGPGWTHGTDIDYLRRLVAYWRSGFDWRVQERRLNQLEQFTTTIDGLTIHFVHRRSKHADALPLLITHGWPGSFVEFTKIIAPLTDPEAHGGTAADAFHVVMPSIPGFAFSQAPQEPGFDPARIAALEATLMARLGYTRYGVQGGDWGSIISTQVALVDAPHVAGLHLNMCFGAAPTGADANAGLTDRERERLKARQVFQNEETGYQQIQGTKPQTLGVALNDSPVGLAAWIVEKFRTWCDCNGDPETVFTKDELLTNITLYWVTQTAASSARIYYESRHAPPSPTAGRRIETPTACADFPKEIIWSPRRWLEGRYNIVRWTEMPRGGHFAAFEQPALLVGDLRAFFAGLREALR